jgi:hypothetical protein
MNWEMFMMFPRTGRSRDSQMVWPSITLYTRGWHQHSCRMRDEPGGTNEVPRSKFHTRSFSNCPPPWNLKAHGIFSFAGSYQCAVHQRLPLAQPPRTPQTHQGEGHILLALVRPLQSGGSAPAARWPGHSAGPVAVVAGAHRWAMECPSQSLWGTGSRCGDSGMAPQAEQHLGHLNSS